MQFLVEGALHNQTRNPLEKGRNQKLINLSGNRKKIAKIKALNGESSIHYSVPKLFEKVRSNRTFFASGSECSADWGTPCSTDKTVGGGTNGSVTRVVNLGSVVTA